MKNLLIAASVTFVVFLTFLIVNKIFDVPSNNPIEIEIEDIVEELVKEQTGVDIKLH